MTTNQIPPAQQYLVKVIITLAFCASCVILGIMALIANKSREALELAPEFQTTLYVLAGAALFMLIVGHILATRATASQPLSSGPVAPPASNKFFVLYIVSLAVRESAAVIGFVATMLSADTSWGIGAAAATLLSIVSTFPRKG